MTRAIPVDPRETITPEAFSVAPELVGRPLARPLRRAAAILLDLLLIAILVALGGRLLFLVAAVWFVFRFASSAPGGVMRRVWRIVLLLVALVLLYFALRSAWNSILARLSPPAERAPATAPRGISTGREGLAALGDVIALRNATTAAAAQPLADRLAERLHSEGLEPNEIEVVLLDAGLREQPWAAEVTAQALGTLSAPEEQNAAPADSLVLAYAVALEADDSAGIAELRPQVGQALAADRLQRLEHRTARLEQSNRELQSELREARESWGILRLLRRVADDLGLGFGWSGLYFTAFTALWEGQTPGKRLLRIRVLRLDGKPMGWWMSFERFGGYAAGFATGLLGFLQVFWDRNRQGIHDKITETVVVRL